MNTSHQTTLPRREASRLSLFDVALALLLVLGLAVAAQLGGAALSEQVSVVLHSRLVAMCDGARGTSADPASLLCGAMMRHGGTMALNSR